MPKIQIKIIQKNYDALLSTLNSFDADARRLGVEFFLKERVSLEKAESANSENFFAAIKVKEENERRKMQSRNVYCHSPEGFYGDDAWNTVCTCARGEGCRHGVAALLFLKEFFNGNVIPNPKPKELDDANFLLLKEYLENANARPLSEPEIKYTASLAAFWKNNRATTRFGADNIKQFAAASENTRSAFNRIWGSEDLLDGMWEAYPSTPLGLWQCVAFAFDKRKIDIPDFMRPATSFAQVEERMKRVRHKREIDSWTERLGAFEKQAEALGTASAAAEAPLHDIRVAIEDSQLKWLFQPAPDAAWTPAKPKQLKAWFARFSDGDDALPESYKLLIAAYIAAHAGSDYVGFSVRFNAQKADEHEIAKFIGAIFSQPRLRSLLADLRGLPVEIKPAALLWRLAPDPGNPDNALLELAAGAGGRAPELKRLVKIRDNQFYDPNNRTLYDMPQAFEHGGYAPVSLPIEAVRNPAGLRAMRRLRASVENVDLPALETLAFKPVYNCACSEPTDYNPSGMFMLKLFARAADGAIARAVKNASARTAENAFARANENASASGGAVGAISRAYTAQGWSAFALPDGAPLCEADMSACAPAVAHLSNFKLQAPRSYYSSGDNSSWSRAMTRAFPDEFAEWAAQARGMGIGLECDPLLAGLLRDPEKVRVEIDLDPAAGSGIDWFDLRLSLTPEDSELTPEEAQLLVAARGRFVFLPGKGYRRAALSLTPGQERELQDIGLDPAAFAPGQRQRLHTFQVAEHILGMLPEEHARRLRDRRDALRAIPPPPLPETLKATLRPYQAEGYHFLSHLAANSLGGILADDMGLGKTVQTLAWLLRLAQGKPGAKILIVCPKSVVPNWRNETARFAPSLLQGAAGETPPPDDAEPADAETAEAETAAAAARAIFKVINYAQLRREADNLRGIQWDAVILDEGQNIKNPASLTAKAARDLPAAQRLVLTGTPVENSTLDLWSLFAFAMPGLLGTQASFKRLYDARKDPLALGRLSRRVTPFMLRRSKAQVASELPPRIEEDLLVELEPAQQKLYDAELKRARQILLDIKTARDFDAQRFNVLHSLLRLRQICCHPALLGVKSGVAESAKFEALFDQIEPILAEGHKLLIFSQFTALLDLLSAELRKRDLPHLTITGKTENRQSLVDRFQQPGAEQILLLSLKAAGTGLNLTAASYVVLFDPWWNPAVEAQAIDRTHRIGQSSQVVAYRLIAQNTVEEKIRQLQKEKAAVASAIVQEESLNTVLNLDDLRNILE